MKYSLKDMMNNCLRPNTGLLIMRIVVGAIFIAVGADKLVSIPIYKAMFFQMGLAGFWVYVVALGELLGGLALMLGYFTWVANVILGAIMLVATVIMLRLGSGLMGALASIILFFVNVQYFLVGAGRYSLDNKFSNGGCTCCAGFVCGNCESKKGGKNMVNGKVCPCGAESPETCECDENCDMCDCKK